MFNIFNNYLSSKDPKGNDSHHPVFYLHHSNLQLLKGLVRSLHHQCTKIKIDMYVLIEKSLSLKTH